MAATIQHIELPKKPRAKDTSTSTHVISQELIVNGDFASDTAWGKVASTITGGKGVINATSGGRNSSLNQQVLTQGKRYRLVFDVSGHNTDTTDSKVVDIESNTIYAITGNATGITVEFTHKTPEPYIFFQALTDSAYDIDNVSILEIETFSNNNHGQIYSGRALEFDGVTDSLTASTGVDTEMPHMIKSGTFTVACWIKQNSSKDQTAWYAVHTNSDNSRVGLGFGDNGEVAFVSYSAAENYTYTGSTSANPVNINTWYRAVCVMTSGSQKMYLNGVELTGVAQGSANALGSTHDNKFIVGEKNNVYFDGAISDFQSWDAAWSADDIAYDYANPESLALNASGTALTEGNLKLWYPMQDGHRGQQSYILDGANTGLGVELVDLSSFASATGWAIDGSEIEASGTTALFKQPFTLGAGKTFKITIVVDAITQGNFEFWIGGYSEDTPTISSADTYTYYVTSGSSEAYMGFNPHSSLIATISSVSVKAINDKHHATTVFHGDEQIAILKNRTGFASSDWVAHGIANENVTVVSSKLQVVTETDAAPEGVKLPAGNFVNDLVTGRTYRVSVDLKQTSGATTPAMKIELGSAQSSPFNISASSVTYTKDIIAVDDDDLIIFSNSSSSATTFTVDNVSIQEVGVASGWTDADQQLDIAQTALQSYNEMAWFDGFNDRLAVTEFNFEVGQSINMWVFINDTSASRDFFGKQGGIKDFVRTKLNSSTHEIQFETHLNDNTVVASLGSAGVIREGEWVMWTFIWISDRTFKVYMNGIHTGTSTATNNSADGKLLKVNSFGNAQANNVNMQGAITEISYYNDQLAQNEINDLYNDGKAKSALEASGFAGLVHYWRNNGLSTWTDLKGTNNGAPTSRETLLCPQGVDGTRCSQGYIMNRARDTSSLNFTTKLQSGYVDVGPLAVDFGTGDFSAECWVQYGFINDSTFGVTGSGLNVVFSNGLANSENTEGINLLSTASDFKFRIGDGDKEDTKNIVPDPLTVGKWYHIVVTREGTAVIIYLDGAAHATKTITSGIDIGNEPFKIGNDRVAADRQYKKPIDGFKLYSKALDLAEVKRNYKATKGSHRN